MMMMMITRNSLFHVKKIAGRKGFHNIINLLKKYETRDRNIKREALYWKDDVSS